MGKSEQNMKEKLLENFTSFDTFGTSLSFQIKGGGSYNSAGGAFLTILIYAIVMFYSINKWEKMTQKADTNFQQNIETNKIEMTDLFSFENTEFNIAFTLVPNDWGFTHYNPMNISDYVEFDVYLRKV